MVYFPIMQSKKAIITGISGQDGSYLTELLLKQGYEVHGIVLQVEYEKADQSFSKLSGYLDQIQLHPGSIEAYPSIMETFKKVQPDECYHLAAASFVSFNIEDEFSIFNVNINGTHNILSVIKQVAPDCKFYFAGSSELYGNAKYFPQNESTPFNPRSAYGISKLTGYHLTRLYRENYKLFACNGILYNHESPRRGIEFVTRKITHAAAQIKKGLTSSLSLGNLDARRDWGFAKDYVKAMWLMLQQPIPDDYVISTGQLHSVREVCDLAFQCVGLDYRDYVKVDERYMRPDETTPLVGDSSKAKKVLGWQPSISFTEMIEMMVDYDLKNT
jgi:GDPmannose 4,6-dehydratase